MTEPRRVVALHVAPAHHEPMAAVEAVAAVLGEGLLGDRWFGSNIRHVSVQAEGDLAAAAHDLGRAVTPDRTRRNVTISGDDVPTTPGTRLRIGEVELEVVRLAAPCLIMEESMGPGGRAALRRRGGVVCRLVTSGSIRIGDPFSTLPA